MESWERMARWIRGVYSEDLMKQSELVAEAGCRERNMPDGSSASSLPIFCGHQPVRSTLRLSGV